MKTQLITVLAVAIVAAALGTANAQLDNHSVTVEVLAINEVAITGNATLTISTATAGSDPDDATDNSTSYAITTNQPNRKLTAAIDVNMPTGMTLALLAVAPAGGTPASKNLSTVAKDIVTGVSTLSESGLQLGYTLSATAAAGTLSSVVKTVTITVVAGA